MTHSVAVDCSCCCDTTVFDGVSYNGVGHSPDTVGPLITVHSVAHVANVLFPLMRKANDVAALYIVCVRNIDVDFACAFGVACVYVCSLPFSTDNCALCVAINWLPLVVYLLLP